MAKNKNIFSAEQPPQKRRRVKVHHPTLWATIFVVLFILFSAIVSYLYFIRLLVVPGVKIGDISLGGKTEQEAAKIIESAAEQILSEGFTFRAGGEEITLKPNLVSLSTQDIAVDLVGLDSEATVARALTVGRMGSWWESLEEQIRTVLFGREIELSVVTKRDEIIALLKNNFVDKETEVVEPHYELRNGILTVMHGQAGSVFSYERAVDELLANLTRLKNQPIALALEKKEPRLDPAAFEYFKERAAELLNKGVEFVFESRRWPISSDSLLSALVIEGQAGEARMVLRAEALKPLLNEIGSEINQKAAEARFELEGNRAVMFQAPQEGRMVDAGASLSALNNVLAASAASSAGEIIGAELSVNRVAPRLSSVAEEYGIRELIGVGRTSFAGSPPNRIHNIKVGVSKLDGLLIAPGETFSALAALRPFVIEAGYKPELVIKGNRTIPEIGGGMCQLGTTLFRATINSGLPVLARQNHSYRVGYYEPPVGMDATIYDPAPDFQFLNDTGRHILIKGFISETDLVFEFWGTKDGRAVKISEPIILSSSDPPPTKYIETLDLKPGERKCTEKAHPGARTTFTYTVIYPDGQKQEREFKSYYRPWQAVCLVGVEKLSEEPALPNP